MSTHEKYARRSKLEKVVSALSIRSLNTTGAGGGKPDMEPCHYAAMLANMKGDPWLVSTAQHLLFHVYLNEPGHEKPLANALMRFVGLQILDKHPELSTSGKEIREVIALTIKSVRAAGVVTLPDAERAGIGRKRWEKMKPVYHLALDRIANAEYALIEHLSGACT